MSRMSRMTRALRLFPHKIIPRLSPFLRCTLKETHPFSCLDGEQPRTRAPEMDEYLIRTFFNFSVEIFRSTRPLPKENPAATLSGLVAGGETA